MNNQQEYLTSKLFTNQQCFPIFALKRKTLGGVKNIFQSMYSKNTLCPLCERNIDTQEERFINYSHLTGNINQQHDFLSEAIGFQKSLPVNQLKLIFQTSVGSDSEMAHMFEHGYIPYNPVPSFSFLFFKN